VRKRRSLTVLLGISSVERSRLENADYDILRGNRSDGHWPASLSASSILLLRNHSLRPLPCLRYGFWTHSLRRSTAFHRPHYYDHRCCCAGGASAALCWSLQAARAGSVS